MTTLATLSPIYALLAPKNDTEFLYEIELVAGVTVAGNSPVEFVHDRAGSEEHHVVYVAPQDALTHHAPPAKLAGQPVYPRFSTAVEKLRERHRNWLRSLGRLPPPTVASTDPLTMDDVSEAAARQARARRIG
jgi:hypothetical protein